MPPKRMSPEEVKKALEEKGFKFGPVSAPDPRIWLEEEIRAGNADIGVTVAGFWSSGRPNTKI